MSEVKKPVTLFLVSAILGVAPLRLSAPPKPPEYATVAHNLTTISSPTVQGRKVTYQIVTNEITAQQADGSKVEVYRFDPSVYVVRQGDQVSLQIRGLKGHDHPLLLEGYNLHAVVHRNQTTTLSFHANKVGTYRMICTAHADATHQGPMEGYLVVIP